MKTAFKLVIVLIIISFPLILLAADGLIDAFPIQQNDLELNRLAQPGRPFDKVGRKFAILGEESGSFEAWAYPLKLFRNFEFSFFLGTSTRPITAKDIVHSISVTPEATVITYVYQSFVLKAIYVTPVDQAAALIFLSLNSEEPLSIVCSFLPVLQPMWPAGIGGQYAYWNKDRHAYLISEPTRQNNAMLGSPYATRVSATPAHMLSDSPNEFKIDITDPDEVRNKYIPIYITGGNESRDSLFARYNKLQEDPKRYYLQNVEYYRKLRENTLQVTTPASRLDVAFEWAKVAYDNLMVSNPLLGTGLLAGLHASGTSGRPGFGWYFGGDAYMNMLSINSYGNYTTVKDALVFTQKWQREDGKMAHELSQAEGYIDWWKDYPYGFIHADTTPFYIVAMYDYYRRTGDLPFIKDGWNSLKKAYQWCLSTDANKDGLMDNKKAGLGASEYGALTGIETDVYLGAVWVKATQEMEKLADAVGDRNQAEKAAMDYRKALQAFQKKFWFDSGGFYAYAFSARGDHVKEVSPWLSVGLMWELGTAENSLLSLQNLNSAKLTTDWGVRLLSSESRFFNSVGYNYGAIWPFVTGWVTMAQYIHHQALQGYQLLMGNVQHTYTDQLGMMPEVLSGMFNTPLEESVSHQGFSSGGIVLPFVRGLLGLRGNCISKILVYSPQFPANWERVTVRNHRLGNATFDLDFTRSDTLIQCKLKSVKGAGYTFRFAPNLAAGTVFREARLNGRAITFQTKTYQQQSQAIVEIYVSQDSQIVELIFQPTVALLPAVIDSHVGDSNCGLKIISVQRDENKLNVQLEGLAGDGYSLSITQPEKVVSVQGAEIQGDQIMITFPQGEPGKFVNHRISLIIE